MNPTTFILPLTNLPQSFNISLGSNNYVMTVKWNYAAGGGWLMGFADQATGVEIVDNIPFVCGVDCLAGLEYLGFDGNLVAYTNGDPTAVPTLDNLGVDSNLYFISPAASTVIS